MSLLNKLKSLYEEGYSLFKKYREIVVYIIFGGLTTLVNFVGYIVLTRIMGMEAGIANVVAIIISILFAYVTNKIWVFESKTTKIKEVLKEMFSFFGCRAFTSLLDIGLFDLLVYVFHISDIWVKIFNQIIVIVLNYVLSKVIVFRKEKKSRKGEREEEKE